MLHTRPCVHADDDDQEAMNGTATRTTDCIPASTGLEGDLLQIMPWPYLSKDDGPMVTRRWVRPAIVLEVSFVEWTRESPSTFFPI
jgi:hypothetical protein